MSFDFNLYCDIYNVSNFRESRQYLDVVWFHPFCHMPSDQAPFKEAIEEHTLGLESNLKVATTFEQEEKKSP